MGRLFGTDGIRGAANVDLTPILAYDLGRAVGHLLDGEGRGVVVGQDTRRSGDMLVAALSAGLAAVGTDVLQLGVVTTPCLAFVAEHGGHAAGVMVSASHNPADDNGLKVVSGGRKVDDEVEDQLERLIFQAEALPGRRNAEVGRLAGDTARAATSDEVKDLKRQAQELKEVVAEQALELRLLKKSMIADGGDVDAKHRSAMMHEAPRLGETGDHPPGRAVASPGATHPGDAGHPSIDVLSLVRPISSRWA